MIKKRIIIISLILIAILLMGIVQTYYTRKATIVDVQNTTIIVEDKIGHRWEFKGEDYNIGEHITLVMNTNSTENYISDDKIVGVYK